MLRTQTAWLLLATLLGVAACGDGETGPAGPAGEQGPPGDPGDPGDPGGPGDPGDPGDPGMDGMDGVDGRDGMDGADGAQLPPGAIRGPVVGPFIGLAVEPGARITTGVFDEGAAEIVVYDADNQQLLSINADAGNVRVTDLSTVSAPAEVGVLDAVTDAAADAASDLDGLNSVAVANGVVAVAIAADPVTDDGAVAFYDAATRAYLGAVDVGPNPDNVVFTPDGATLLVANEGEPDASTIDVSAFPTIDPAELTDPEGSVSVISVPPATGDFTTLSARSADFTAFNGMEALLVAQGARFPGQGFNAASTLAQELEPEYITTDGTTAWVTLQENNALAVVDVATATVSALVGLGVKDHSIETFGLDASDEDGPGGAASVNIRPWPIVGMYQPDTIVSYVTGGRRYLVTANEGDGRELEVEVAGEDEVIFADEVGIDDLTLDPEAYPDAAELADAAALGELNLSLVDGDVDDDGDVDLLHAFGSRSFSIWDAATGALVFDSGNDFEVLTARLFGAAFNNDNTEGDGDSRSDNKGPEPEAIAVATLQGRAYAFIGLERVGGVAIYDVTVPNAPIFQNYIEGFAPRDFSLDEDALQALIEANGADQPDLGPESIVIIDAADSPNGEPLMVVGNEVSGTIAIYALALDMFPFREFGDFPPTPTAEVRVVHASPDAPAIDVRVAGESSPFVSGLMPQAASGYAEVPAGETLVEVLDGSGSVVFAETLSLTEDRRYVIVAAGLAGSSAPEDQLRLLTFEERTTAPGPGLGTLDLVHASPDAPAVDVDADLDGAVDVTGLARFTRTAMTLDLDAGAARADVQVGGASVSTFSFDVVEGDQLFVLAVGLTGALPRADEAFGLLVVGPATDTGSPTAFVAQDPRLHVVHAALNLGAGDVFLGAREVASDIEFGEMQGPLQVAPRVAGDLDVFAPTAGTTRPFGAPAETATAAGLEAGERYLVVLHGDVDTTSEPFAIGVLPERIEPDAALPTRPRVVGFHASPDANDQVEVSRSDDPASVSPLSFTAIAGLEDLRYGVVDGLAGLTLDETGPFVFGVGDEGAPLDVDAFFDPVDLGAGFGRYFVVATGYVDIPAIFTEPLRLLIVEATDDGDWTLTTLDLAFPVLPPM